MSRNNKTYKLPEYLDLKQFLNNNNDNLNAQIVETIDSVLKMHDNFFGKLTESEVSYLLKVNSEFRDNVEKIKNQIINTKKQAKLVKFNIERILNGTSKNKEDIEKAISAIENRKELNDELDVINDKLSNSGLSAKEKNDLETLKTKIEIKIDKNEKALEGFDETKLKVYAKLAEKSKLTTEDTIKMESKLADSMETTNEAIENRAKGIDTINLALKEMGSVFMGYVKNGFEKWKEIDEKVYTVGRNIGLTSKELRGYQINVMNNYDDMASKLGMTFEELFKFQENYTKSTGRAIVLTNNQIESLGAVSKLVGEVATNEMVENMDNFGASTQTASSYLAVNMARARSQGLDAQKASEIFAKNVKLAASHNFREGVNGISKMTLLSQKLKFNMDSIANAADKFETIEGAIGTAANLQMLGGSYATQFGNPLEVMNMAMLDMEGFTNKIIDTFSGKAIFNRETGQVEMSAIDKRLMKEAAKQLGISYDEAWNIASQQAKASDIERDLSKNTQTFTEDEKSFITSKTQFIDGKHKIVYYDEDGNEQKVDVENLSKEQLNEIRSQKDVEHAIQGDVHGIHKLLHQYVTGEALEKMSWNEQRKGANESIAINFADIHDEYMSPVKNLHKDVINEDNSWKLASILGVLVGGVTTAIPLIFSKMMPNISEGLGDKIFDLFSGLGKRSTSGGAHGGGAHGGGFIGKIKNGVKTIGRSVGKGAKWVGKNSLKLVKNPKIGIPLAIATAGATLLGLTSSSDGSQVDKSKLGGREVEPNDINPNELESTSVNKTEELTELEKQTILLSKIADKQGVDVNKILDLSKTNNANTIQEAGITESTLGFVSATFGDKIYNNYASKSKYLKPITNINNSIGSRIDKSWIGKKYNNSVLEKGIKIESEGNKLIEKGKSIGSRKGAKQVLKGRAKKAIASKVATSLGSKGLAGPAGWVGFGVDIVNMGGKSIGLWEEGSHTDKLMNIGSKTASYAGIGAMIAGPVGAAVGGAVGLVSGTIQQYGKEIKDFGSKVYNGVKDGLFGSDNMSESDKIQQQYEESKIGIVDIRDPQLEQKAQLATCQIHDIIVSMWYHMNGKQSNGLEKDNGLIGNVGDSISTVNNVIGGALVNMVSTPFKIIGSLFGSKNNTNNNKYNFEETLNPNNYYNSSNMLFDNILVKDSYYNSNSSVMSKPVVGTPTHIKKTVDFNSPSYKDNLPINNKLDLNISGTIKLTTDKGGNSVDIDLTKLLSNSEFVSKLTEVITNRLSENANGGRLDKNSFKTITHSSGRREMNG